MSGARDFPVTARGIDLGFVSRQRSRGIPEAAIARMGGWCVADVQAVPADPFLIAADRPAPMPNPPLRAVDIPAVCEILDHIAQQYEITVSDLLGESREQYVVAPRHEAYAVVWELNRFTAKQIAELFNKTVPGITFGLRRHYERINTRGYGRDW